MRPILLFCLCLICWGATPARVYVEPFGNKPGAANLREELLHLLKKQHEIEVVSTPAAADFVVAGSGETYIRGYVGSNPKVRYLNSDSTPIYGGYLSVELKTAEHDTVWSYLATPRRLGADDINRNLASQVVPKIAEVIGEQRKAPAH